MTLNRASCAATLEAIAEGSAATHERQGHRGHRKALLLLISRRSPALSYGTFALAARRNALFVVIIATASPLALASDALAHHVRLRKAAHSRAPTLGWARGAADDVMCVRESQKKRRLSGQGPGLVNVLSLLSEN